MTRILLVWDSFGEDDLCFYLLDPVAVPEWLPECHGQYLGQGGLSEEQDRRLEELYALRRHLAPYRVTVDGVTAKELGCVRIVLTGQLP